MTERFEIVGCGVDDVTIGFDMKGSRSSIQRLRETPGFASRRGKILAAHGERGKFAHLLGRSVSFWREETNRLYVQAKLAEEGHLAPLDGLSTAVDGLLERMAFVGLTSYEPAFITRLDVAVDGRCLPEDGKLLLDALEGCRPPNGWRVRSVGVPRSTVYFSARSTESVKARSYCRNLKTRRGDPFGLIRLEAEQRYEPGGTLLEAAFDPRFGAGVWRSRFGGLSAKVSRLPREVQTIELARRVIAGELRYSQGERLSMLVDLERIGLDQAYYPRSVLSSRRAEARSVGLAANEINCSVLEVDLSELLAPYEAAVERAVGERLTLGPMATDAGPDWEQSEFPF